MANIPEEVVKHNAPDGTSHVEVDGENFPWFTKRDSFKVEPCPEADAVWVTVTFLAKKGEERQYLAALSD